MIDGHSGTVVENIFYMALQSLHKRMERVEGVLESVVEELGKDAWEKSQKDKDDEDKDDWWKKGKEFRI